MASKALLFSFVFGLLLCAYAAESVNTISHGRALLGRRKRILRKLARRRAAKRKALEEEKKPEPKKPKEEVKKKEEAKEKASPKGKKKGKDKELDADKKREAAALKAYEKEKKRREKEKQSVIKRARKEASGEIAKYRKATSDKQRLAVFINLWKNAKGPTILIVLKMLIQSDKKSQPKFVRVVAESMVTANRRGYSFQISDGLWQALTLVEKDKDGEPLLQAVLLNVKLRNNAKKGSGCIYVRNLFTDAETLAIENGYEIEFTKSFDSPEFLQLAECFYAKCEKDALKCCKEEEAVQSGRCGCLKKEPNTCAFNLFLNTPRPIWRCNGEACKIAKCLCPVIKTKKKSTKGKSSIKGKPETKGKTPKKEVEEKPAKKPAKSKSSDKDSKRKGKKKST